MVFLIYILCCFILCIKKETSLIYSVDDLKSISKDFEDCITGVSKHREPDMFLKSYVFLSEKLNLTDIDEKMLAIDFGGTSLKLGIYKLKNEVLLKEGEIKRITIPMDESSKDIDAFDWAASEIKKYLGHESNPMKAGLTFSYPVEQTSISSGTILSLHKNFPFKPLNDGSRDPVLLLNEALKRQGVKVEVKVLANDTVATLMSEMPKKDDFQIGIVLGTGTNAAFFGSRNKKEAINAEWANFNAPSLKMTKYDEIIKRDLESQNKEWKPLDCMLAGYKFIDLLNHIAAESLQLEEKFTLKMVKQIIDERDENDERMTLIRNIKIRSIRIIAALIHGILKAENVKPETRVVLIFNGTIIEQEFDYSHLTLEFLELSSAQKNSLFENFTLHTIKVEKDASLTGVINILINELQGK